MKRFLLLSLTLLLTLPLFALDRHPQADTIGMTVTRTYRTIQTTILVEQIMDSIVSIDAYSGEKRITTVTFDTLIGEETIETLDTTFFITEPLRFWRLESVSIASLNMTARGYWQSAPGVNSLFLDLQNTSSAVFERGSSIWRTTFNWRYGTQTQGGEFRNWLKANDVINLQSRYNFRASPVWLYSSQFQFETQITRTFASVAARDLGRDNYSSRFLSPATLSFSIGMEYNPQENIKLLLSPITYRATYVSSPKVSVRTHFGVDTITGWLHTFGPMAQLENRHNLTNDITIRSNLMLFADILHMDRPFVLFDWNFGISVQLTRLFAVGLETHIIYNPNVFFPTRLNDPTYVFDPPGRRRWQIQQGAMLRFTHRITN